MNYTTIFILNNDKGGNIVERPREFVGNILKAIEGQYHTINYKDLVVGFEKIGEVLPLKSEADKSVYIQIGGKLQEFNPFAENFLELMSDEGYYDEAISLLESIYNKVKEVKEIKKVKESNEEDFVDFGENLDNFIGSESDVTELVDEKVEEPKPKKTRAPRTTKAKKK